MPKTHTKQVKKGKFKMLLFFLLIAFFMWFLTKFSNEFTATVDATIQYKNLPNNTILASNNIDEISFDLTSNGFDFLSYRLKKPIITINVVSYYNDENQIVKISNNDLIKIIISELKNNIEVKNISVNEIEVVLDKIVSKEIPIKVISDITYKNGFKAVGEIAINPSSIIISGPSIVIDSMEQLTTKPIQLELLYASTFGEVEIDTSNILNVVFSEEKVSYSITIEEFTQKELHIPVMIENLPIGINVKLIPDFIPIVFDVSVTKFNSFSENDFSIICDYNKRNLEESFMKPELVKKPTIIENVILNIDKIEYLIFK